MSTPRARRIGGMDRTWVGERSVMLATPLRGLSIDSSRAMLARFMAEHPASPFSCRLDMRRRTWVPVPASERTAHLDRVLVPAPDPVDGAFAEHVAAHLPPMSIDLPFVAYIGDSSLLLVISHATGDAISSTRLTCALAHADLDMLAGLAAARTPTAAPVTALLRQLNEHRAEWFTYMRNPSRPPALPADGTCTSTGARPAFVGVELDNVAVKAVTRWRNTHARGVSLASVLTTATHNALVRAGVHLDGNGYYALFDARAYLSDVGARRYGNLGKSLYLAADLADPAAVGAAMGAAQDARRVLPAMVVASAMGQLPAPPPSYRPYPDGAAATLTFNMLPSLPGLDELPWSDAGPRRYFGFGASNGPGGISVLALRMRDHLQLTASFDEATASAATVTRALTSMSTSPESFAALVER